MKADRDVRIAGLIVDDQTRCTHYHSAQDVVAIKFACSRTFYPCVRCHVEIAGHSALVWPQSEWDKRAVLCGVCYSTMTISAYLEATSCTSCGAEFNPGCSAHHHLYFDVSEHD